MSSFSYSIEQLAKFCGAQFKGANANANISQLIIDSRKAKDFNAHLFIAIKGSRHDGHNFIKDLYKRGCRNFLISQPNFNTSDYPEGNFLVTSNSLFAFQDLARNHRLQFNIPIIGITGSNGKTIVKEWLNTCLKKVYNTCKSPKSYNSQVGVSLSVTGLKQAHEIGIFEAGISQKGEMMRLKNIIQPNIGIFTNIGQAHSENFESLKEKTREKASLFTEVEKLVYCKDHKEVHEAVIDIHGAKLYDWSTKDNNSFLYVKNIRKKADKSTLTLIHNNTEKVFYIPFNDKASTENCLQVICALISLNMTSEKIQLGLDELQPIEMRMELKEAKGNSLLINDSYSSDLDSIKIALDFLQQQSGNAKKVVILSDLDQTGMKNSLLLPKLMSLLETHEVEHVLSLIHI